MKAAELRKSHLSLPVNPDIAHMVFLRGYIEKIGRGTIKIMDACKAAGLKAPKWNTNETSVKLSFPLNVRLGGATDRAVDGANDRAINLTNDRTVDPASNRAIDRAIDRATDDTKKKLAKLLKAIMEDEGRRNPDYQKATNLGSESTIKRYLDQLREAGFIEFRGTAPQTGGYFITDKLKKIINS